jgi:hypothetical protein
MSPDRTVGTNNLTKSVTITKESQKFNHRQDNHKNANLRKDGADQKSPKRVSGDDTDEETIQTVKMQLRAAFMEEVVRHMQKALFQLGGQ